ncbi:MAG: SDR family NAD(P)-dependent oxidoreductase, partial [Planctomycetota bacterium]|nr:SDR family NAD(P)-dependent oxidoreductase [Planctomycetota bacterium]
PRPRSAIYPRVRAGPALVSGASRGIGRALAAGFASRGARVIITGRNKETLAATAEEIGVDGNVEAVVCDVASVDSIRSAVQYVRETYGRIDTLVSVAGVNIRQPATAFTEEDYDFVVDINLKGAFFIAQQVGKVMLEQGSGSIINIDSLNTYAPLKNVAPYALSKAGVVMMTRSLAVEWGPGGVRVNTLAPGFILTDLTQKLWSDPTMQAWGETNTPLTRLGNPEDMVGTAVFLASDASAFMTGQVVRVDGGFSAGVNWPIPSGGGQ